MTKSRLKKYLAKIPFATPIALACWSRIKRVKRKRCQRQLGRALLAHLRQLKPSVDRVWYCCVPTHPNLGDQAQACCIAQWLGEQYPQSEIVEITNLGFDYAEAEVLRHLRTLVQTTDLIVFQSGYTMTGTHEYENCRAKIIAGFPQNRIVIFPQTIRYDNAALRQQAIDTYHARPNMILMARDRTSYETATALFADFKILLYPDIVTSRIGTRSYAYARSGILFCMRADDERLYSEATIDSLIQTLSARYDIDKTDTTVQLDCRQSHQRIWGEIEKTIEGYAKYRLVITDRYHGTIFSLIANTPVIVLNSTDHKLKTGIEWFRGVYDDYVYHAETPQEVEALVASVMGKTFTYALTEHFDSTYYKQLKAKMDGSGR